MSSNTKCCFENVWIAVEFNIAHESWVHDIYMNSNGRWDISISSISCFVTGSMRPVAEWNSLGCRWNLNFRDVIYDKICSGIVEMGKLNSTDLVIEIYIETLTLIITKLLAASPLSSITHRYLMSIGLSLLLLVLTWRKCGTATRPGLWEEENEGGSVFTLNNSEWHTYPLIWW